MTYKTVISVVISLLFVFTIIHILLLFREIFTNIIFVMRKFFKLFYQIYFIFIHVKIGFHKAIFQYISILNGCMVVFNKLAC